MTLQQLHLTRHRLQSEATTIAADRDRLNRARIFGRIKPHLAGIALGYLNEGIRQKLNQALQITFQIEDLEGLYSYYAIGDLALSPYPLTYEERKALADEAKLANSKHKAQTYPIKRQTAACSSCDGTGTSNLSTPWQQETCTACDGTGYAA